MPIKKQFAITINDFSDSVKYQEIPDDAYSKFIENIKNIILWYCKWENSIDIDLGEKEKKFTKIYL